MNVLVCGGRNYVGDVSCLSMLPFKIDIVVHGDALGADRKAGRWAVANGIHEAKVGALWDFYKKRAGTLRNGAMLLLDIHYCVAFPGGRGTANMIRLCRECGVPVWEPYPNGAFYAT